MPTIVREAGFDIRIYTLDHPPPHVHVERAGTILKINLATAKVVRIVGTISDRDIGRAERLVAKHSSALKEAWRRLHGHP
jgi:hypothetical protein